MVQSVKYFIFVHGWKTNFKCTCIKKKKISQLVILIMNVFWLGMANFEGLVGLGEIFIDILF